MAVAVAVGLGLCPGSPAADPPVTPAQIDTWIEQLGDPDFEVRQNAVSRLYSCGPAALTALDQASRGPDYESALNARGLVQRIQKLFLVGAQVELSASRKEFRWDQPLALRLTIRNPSDFPIHLPFLIHDRESLDADALSRQVGDLLDAADFLQVHGPDGRLLDLTVEDYRGHPQLSAALDARVYREPASLLPAHGRFALTMEEFNRGFARYRMLEEGDYRVRFAYVPEWDDPALRDKGLGLVISNELTLRVTRSAPPEILRAQRPLQARLEQRGGMVVLSLVNTHDRSMGVNLNLGPKGAVNFAHIEWGYEDGGAITWTPHNFGEVGDLSAERLRLLKPGEVVELLRWVPGTLPGLGEVLAGGGTGHGSPSITLRARYANLLDRATLLRRTPPGEAERDKLQAILDALPLPTFVGQVTSEPLTVPLRAQGPPGGGTGGGN